MQGLWPAVCLRRHQGRDYRGATEPGGTFTLREDRLAWHLPRGRRQYSVVDALYRHLLCATAGEVDQAVVEIAQAVGAPAGRVGQPS